MPSLFGYLTRYATIARCPNSSAVINQLAKSKVITDIVGEKNALMNELTRPESSGPIALDRRSFTRSRPIISDYQRLDSHVTIRSTSVDLDRRFGGKYHVARASINAEFILALGTPINFFIAGDKPPREGRP